eukprot:gene3060-2042_t
MVGTLALWMLIMGLLYLWSTMGFIVYIDFGVCVCDSTVTGVYNFQLSQLCFIHSVDSFLAIELVVLYLSILFGCGLPVDCGVVMSLRAVWWSYQLLNYILKACCILEGAILIRICFTDLGMSFEMFHCLMQDVACVVHILVFVIVIVINLTAMLHYACVLCDCVLIIGVPCFYMINWHSFCLVASYLALWVYLVQEPRCFN